RHQMSECSSVSFRRRTSSRTSTNSAALVATATICSRSVMTLALDDVADGDHQQGEERAGEGERGTRGRERCASGEAWPHPDRDLADTQPVAAQEQHK